MIGGLERFILKKEYNVQSRTKQKKHLARRITKHRPIYLRPELGTEAKLDRLRAMICKERGVNALFNYDLIEILCQEAIEARRVGG
tara:strand:- start:16 stop:273 length:258 start_codon:yes stop_codon:yes gene_type:complete